VAENKDMNHKKQEVSPTWGVPSEEWAEKGGKNDMKVSAVDKKKKKK